MSVNDVINKSIKQAEEKRYQNISLKIIDLEKIDKLLFDISIQSTRKNRASKLKRYLINDLEIIENKANEIISILDKYLIL